MSAAVWHQGGFADASEEETRPQDPGTEVHNDLFTVEPTRAALRTREFGTQQVVVRAKLTSHESEAEEELVVLAQLGDPADHEVVQERARHVHAQQGRPVAPRQVERVEGRRNADLAIPAIAGRA